MSISFTCSSCEAKLRTKPELAGKRVKCPKCGHAVQVPSTVAVEPASSSGPPEFIPKGPAAPTAKPAAAVGAAYAIFKRNDRGESPTFNIPSHQMTTTNTFSSRDKAEVFWRG